MDVERLKELREETEQYRAVADDRCMSTNYEDGLLALLDEAIARQSVKSEEVQEAIEQFKSEYVDDFEGYPATCEKWNRNIDLAITVLQEYHPWVSVSKRLPESGMPVLVTYIGFHDGKPYSDGVATWHFEENGYSGGWVWEIDGCEVAVEITHWKLLPEPPKGE